MGRAHPIQLVVLLGAMIGCSKGDQDASSQSFRIFEENGVMVAETTGGPKYVDEIFTFEPITVLNQDPQNPESLIRSAQQLTMDTDGFFYVADPFDCRIAVYSPDGEYQRSIGRKGSGPGEYDILTVVCFDGEIFQIWDHNNHRLSRVHRDGTFLDSRRPPGDIYTSRMVSIPDNRFLVWSNTVTNRENFAYTSAIVYTVNAAGDTLARIQTEESLSGAFRTTTSTSGITGYTQFNIPFTSYPDAQYVPGRGIMTTSGMTPEVHWYDLSGEHTATWRLDLAPRRVTTEIKFAYEERLRQREQERARQSGRDPRPITERVYPEYASFWRSSFVDDAGYVWLWVVNLPGESEPGEWARFIVLNPEGCYLGTARLPDGRARLVGNHLLAVITDEESGEETLTIFSIHSSVEGLVYP